MNLSFFISQILILSVLMSCAHLGNSGKHETITLTTEQNDDLNRKALAIASERLEQMVSQAKSNQSLTNYLATDLFLKANMSLLEGDYATASVLFKHVMDLVPNDAFIQKKYAISLIRVGDLETSEIVLEKLYSTSKDEKVGLILAGVYSGVDKEDKARAIYHKILAANA